MYFSSCFFFLDLSSLVLFEISVPTIEGGKGGKTIGYIYSGGTPAGIFTISDTCRSGAAEACRELKKLGIKTAMLTGDSHAAALHTNEQVHYF